MMDVEKIVLGPTHPPLTMEMLAMDDFTMRLIKAISECVEAARDNDCQLASEGRCPTCGHPTTDVAKSDDQVGREASLT